MGDISYWMEDDHFDDYNYEGGLSFNQPSFDPPSFESHLLYVNPEIKMEEEKNLEPSFFFNSNLLPPQIKSEIKTEPNTLSTTTNIKQTASVEQALFCGLNEYDIIIETQPPTEVRTRTPNEIRTFGVNVRVTGSYKKAGATIMKVALYYATNGVSPVEQVKKDILGGTKTAAIQSTGIVIFDNLTISESSTKNKEREFVLQLSLIRNDGTEMMTKCTRPFYAYSHKKVLQRRGSVQLRTLSKTWGKLSGGDTMHVIGSPFIQGPALAIIFRTPHGDVVTKPTEFFSDSVLFFELPAYPLPKGVKNLSSETEVKVSVLVTNDGRTYSNQVEFTYVTDATRRSRF